MERFIAIVRKANVLLVFVLLFSLLMSATWLFFQERHFRTRGAVEVVEQKDGKTSKKLLSFSRAESITGASTLMIRVGFESDSKNFSKSGGRDYEVKNLVFINKNTQKPIWAFADNKNSIPEIGLLRFPSKYDSDGPVKAIYIEYVDKDSNQDGKISDADLTKISLLKADGSGRVDFLSDVSLVLNYELVDEGTLNVLYQKGASIRSATILLPDFKLQSDVEVIDSQ